MTLAARWRDAVVAPDGTHHLLDGAPLYDVRFVEVLKFHAPGLAPARDTSGMYHIDPCGRAAYPERHLRTFGFYEGLAAVQDRAGWRHIHPDGTRAYDTSWDWCGNFQGGRCAARAADGRYTHLRPDGRPVSGTRWRYAGDYRDGVAVVQDDDGLSFHVDLDGRAIHAHRFVDLDVFHKGYARARDARGWTHVDTGGRPAYTRRFAMVEPFYNGQARVEGFDGALEVIDERGDTLCRLREARRDPLHHVSAQLVAFWRCEAVYAAVTSGLAERLPLSEATPAQARLLDALGELELVTRDDAGWHLTREGAYLRRGHPLSLAAAARYWKDEGHRAWAQLGTALETPSWRPADPFAAAAADPAQVAALHAALRPYAEHDYADIARVLDPSHRSIVDAGGGSGALARALLRAHPDLIVTVIERPEVVAEGLANGNFGMRLAWMAGDLFAPWPVYGDGIVLARILHDWPDDEAVAILRNARARLTSRGRLYVVEMVRAAGGFEGALLSLHLLLSTGGRERTRAEFESLFARADLRLVEVRALAQVSDVLVVEAA